MADQVIDASVAVQWVIQSEPLRTEAIRLLNDAKRNQVTLLGPPLLHYEVESIFQRRLFIKQATATTIDTELADFYAVGVQIVTHPDIVRRAREIARLCNQVRIYDSLYAALAELRGCELWTADNAFYNSASAALPFVKHLQTYP